MNDFILAINRNETLMKKARLIWAMKRIHCINLQPYDLAGNMDFVDATMYKSNTNAISGDKLGKPYSKFSPRVVSLEVEMLESLKKHK